MNANHDRDGSAPPRARTSFDQAWRFFKGDVAGGERADLDDSEWRALDVPHDWIIEEPFDRKYNPHTGGLPIAGVGWYRKHLRNVPIVGRRYSIEFDGAMANARVFLNGREIGARPYGYIGFAFDLTPDLRFGGADNVIAVRLQSEEESSRWYPGAGLYRHVWLVETGDIHVARFGTFVTTPTVSDESARVVVRTDLQNHRTTAAGVTLDTAIVDASGETVARTSTARSVVATSIDRSETSLDVPRPHRWDVDDPYLYSAVSEIREGERVVDRYVTPFGVRTIGIDKARGFLLNGRQQKLRGVCMHHDLGALGSAVNDRAVERQLRIMKEMGANAIRTSHNPPAPEVLDWCDRLGLLVMDEAFDMWRKPKVKNGYAKLFDQWAETDLRDMIRRDRNHPSVVLYSIGNEIGEQTEPDGWKIAQNLTHICHDEDPTRKVTAAFNQADEAIQNKLADQVDVPGFNYQAHNYQRFLTDHPDWVIVGSETNSSVSSRGVYHLPIELYPKHPSLQLSSYDIIAPTWGYMPDVEFDVQERLPNVLGEFVWTGFDYIGEPTPYFWERYGPKFDAPDWPARSSYFGIVDLAGFPKDRYFLYQSVWSTKPMVHLLPHWNWAGREGQPIPVMVYTNAESVELFLNGRSLGKKRKGDEPVILPTWDNISHDHKFASKYRLLWQVPYEPGALRAVASTGGQTVATTEMHTAGPPARIRVTPDRTELRADGQDLAFLEVRVEDKNGNLCPLADNLVRFAVEGAGSVAGVDNGNAATVEPFQAKERHAFGGLALLIVRPKRDPSGSIRVVSSADGLESAITVLTTSLKTPIISAGD
ncbi:MAG TPA: beta-galactosidase GalB [Polyangiaceae bacterium]